MKLKQEIELDNKLKRLSKENQDDISRLNESRIKLNRRRKREDDIMFDKRCKRSYKPHW